MTTKSTTTKTKKNSELSYEVRCSVPIELTLSTRGIKFDTPKKIVGLTRQEAVELYGSRYFEMRVVDEDGNIIKDWDCVTAALEYRS
jgi:hypothetical protein